MCGPQAITGQWGPAHLRADVVEDGQQHRVEHARPEGRRERRAVELQRVEQHLRIMGIQSSMRVPTKHLISMQVLNHMHALGRRVSWADDLPVCSTLMQLLARKAHAGQHFVQEPCQNMRLRGSLASRALMWKGNVLFTI